MAASRRLDALLREKPMASGSEVAARITATKKRLVAEMDRLAQRVDEFDAVVPKIVAQADASLDRMKNDLTEMEKELLALSNIPLSEESKE
jgi:hypothetical protein